jgi:formate/nitrite transporter FocA (FNT family)
VGFLIVILGRQQLFTENTLTAVLPLMHDRTMSCLFNVVRLWAIVFAANLMGAHLAAWFYGNTPAVSPDVQRAMHAIGSDAMRVDFWSALVKGIVAGWLIAMVVWLTAAADPMRFASVAIPTYVVGLGGFTHIIAGSVEVLFLVMTGALSWPVFALTFMIPTLIGNCIGGVLLVTALNHAQVVSGEE